jgi:hypothetical protein
MIRLITMSGSTESTTKFPKAAIAGCAISKPTVKATVHRCDVEAVVGTFAPSQ